MTQPCVVIRCGNAYPDAVVERLASQVADSGLPARLEPLPPDAGAADGAGLIAVEVPGAAVGMLPGEALAVTVDALVDAAARRRRRQEAEGEERAVAVILDLPDDVRVVIPVDGPLPGTDLLLRTVAGRRAAGTLPAGTWHWNAANQHLSR